MSALVALAKQSAGANGWQSKSWKQVSGALVDAECLPVPDDCVLDFIGLVVDRLAAAERSELKALRERDELHTLCDGLRADDALHRSEIRHLRARIEGARRQWLCPCCGLTTRLTHEADEQPFDGDYCTTCSGTIKRVRLVEEEEP